MFVFNNILLSMSVGHLAIFTRMKGFLNMINFFFKFQILLHVPKMDSFYKNPQKG